LEKNDDNKFRVTDRKYTEYVLSTKQRALLYAAYISFLDSKAGGRE
jgi:Tfp pilus assembly protein PilZ